ncbi:MAG TPA: FHA domain-containing protein [Candidatus Xenobia bacterium]|jgi:pSer/pThr/pTyr-binding forkhead associated (FHA) protein
MNAPVIGWLFFGRLALAAGLWAAVGVTVRTLWCDLPGPGRVAPSEPAVAASLQVVGSGAQHLINGELTLGRSPDCSLRVEDPFASALHARITWRAPDYVVEDMGSNNGTYLGGSRLQTPHRLSDGDTLRIGGAEFVFRVHA